MTALLADSPVSYYQQLYAILRQEILGGVWKPSERMPSEAELMADYGVSRITVRQAVELLVNDGLVFRRRGSGTFVTSTPVEYNLNRIVSYAEEMARLGMQPGTRMLASRLEPAPADVAGMLAVEPGSELAVIERLRLADDVPMSVERSQVVHHICPGLLDGDYAAGSLHGTLFERYGIRLSRARQTARAIPADKATADLLDVRAGAPLCYVERVFFRQAGSPVEYRQMWCRGDRYELHGELHS